MEAWQERVNQVQSEKHLCSQQYEAGLMCLLFFTQTCLLPTLLVARHSIYPTCMCTSTEIVSCSWNVSFKNKYYCDHNRELQMHI